MGDIAVEMRSITKTFGPVTALADADLVVEKGSIHGLIGQNGAGKSTIIKVLAGIYGMDSGTVSVEGERLTDITPASIERRGVHFIHQDRLLVPTATLAEAIFLRSEPRFGPFLNRRRMNRRASELLKAYFGLDLAPTALIQTLSTAQQKIVQITRALAQDAKVLVLDEPTAALVSKEVESLFAVLRRLREQGIAIIFISHYMQEIRDICDRVTVLRNGRTVGVLDPKEASLAEIVALMIDRDTGEMYPRREGRVGEPVLTVEGLSLSGHFQDVTFDVRAGEIVGLTGLLGSGDKQVLECLFGLKRPNGGGFSVDGVPMRFGAPVDAVKNKIAMIPEDRRAHGVAIGLSVAENISLASLPQVSDYGFVRRGAEARAVDRVIEALKILTPGRRTLVRNLSGGNQQKVAVAKWLSCRSRVYLLDEPTVAVDVGAKVEIYTLMNRLAGEGAAILFLSSDLEEIAEICDRALVIYRGRITREFRRAELDSDRLLAAASGARVDGATTVA